MSQVQTQTRFKVKEIVFKYNIPDTEIEKVLERVMVKKVLDYTPFDNSGKILTYLHRTWGSCREWKLVVFKGENEFVDGEWVDQSSSKNVFKYKLTDLEKLPNKIIIYYSETPSCNQRKQFKFKVVVEVER
ncbi:MAG: hypothetical protein QXL19_07715 [Ignisphaera sp.]